MSSTSSAGAPRTVVYQSYRTRDVPAYAAQLLAPLVCANLCASLAGWSFDGTAGDERCYEAVVHTCLRTAGDVVNRLVAPPA